MINHIEGDIVHLKFLQILLIFTFFNTCTLSAKDDYFTGHELLVGPMIHYEFGGYFTFGVEISHWNYEWHSTLGDDARLFYGYDVGIELFKPHKTSSYFKNLRVYSEFQAGRIIIGNSIGPYYEISFDDTSENRFGIQNTTWGGGNIALDLRVKYDFTNLNSLIGLYGKWPTDIEL
jgi:hypothetical protein